MMSAIWSSCWDIFWQTLRRVSPCCTCSRTLSMPSNSIISSAPSASWARSGLKKPRPYSSLARSFCSIRLNGFFFWALIFRSNTGFRYSMAPWLSKPISCSLMAALLSSAKE